MGIGSMVASRHALDVVKKLWIKVRLILPCTSFLIIRLQVWGQAFDPLMSSSALVAAWPRAQDRPMFYVAVFAAISFTTAVATMTAVIVRFSGSLRASRVLFEDLLHQVVHATMRWHDITPQG